MNESDFPLLVLAFCFGSMFTLAFYSIFEFIDRATARARKRWED